MFGFLTKKEKYILLVGPLMLVAIILFQGWQANHWRAEAVKEEQLKQQWEASYVALNESVDKFNEQQKALTEAVNQLKISQTKQTQDLKNALKKHQDWADTFIPDDVSGVFNHTKNH
ncbi:chemotaxis protein [Haemophilus pittmaniae]|nr:chemotaxis protein [Haemophilus pittmaniae]SNV67242.1 Uncharacterised protein [Haemophilus pittmaniae]